VTTNQPFLSIVVPAYNEESRLHKTLPEFLKFMAASKKPVEIIFVDDGSHDNTSEVIRKATEGLKNARLIKFSVNRGKGAAIREGMLSARGKFRIFADADSSSPIWQAEKLLQAADEKTVVIGSRYVSGSLIKIKQPFYRIFGSRIMNLFIRIILLPDIKDTQCGFKLFRGEVARELFAAARVDGFAFDVEILLLAVPRYKVVEVPVAWRHVEESRVSPGRDAARMLWDVLKLRWDNWRRAQADEVEPRSEAQPPGPCAQRRVGRDDLASGCRSEEPNEKRKR